MRFLFSLFLFSATLFPAFSLAATASVGSQPPAPPSAVQGAAQEASLCPSGQSGLCNPLKAKSITELLNDILTYLVKIGTVFVILMIVYVGFKFTAARGNAGELEKVRIMFLWTVVGALVILGAHVISDMITSTIHTISQTPS
ncbi:MAG TPA: hypothetical protein ENI56_01665 [Candidatus Kaiserbacteria bacterium]|nr:hypothetical protein [Candidatus Kaiserbacteria bacterium]